MYYFYQELIKHYMRHFTAFTTHKRHLYCHWNLWFFLQNNLWDCNYSFNEINQWNLLSFPKKRACLHMYRLSTFCGAAKTFVKYTPLHNRSYLKKRQCRLYTLRLLRPILATNTILSVLPVCSLHIHMKMIAHANNWSLTLPFHNIFTWAPVNFTWAQAWVCLGVAMPLVTEERWISRGILAQVQTAGTRHSLLRSKAKLPL